jgi:uncharacterized protein (DUF983 family)
LYSARGEKRGGNWRAERKQKLSPPACGATLLVAISVTVTPVPILLLLVLIEVVIIAMRISVVFDAPLLVIHGLVTIPMMIIAVIGVINPVSASTGQQWYGQRAGQKNQTQVSRSPAHFAASLGRYP